ANATGPVKLEILDGAGKVVRSYASTDPVPNPDPALDPVAYNRLCQKNPNTADCGLPLYWPAPAMALSTRAGMHRFSWDLHYDAVVPDTAAAGGEDATGAVPHRTYPTVNAPWAPAGAYTVRLTVSGRSYAQPLTLRLDPRVKTPAAGLAQLATSSREMYDGAVAAQAAYTDARALVARLDRVQGSDVAAFRAQVDSLAASAVRPGRGFGRPSPSGAPTLQGTRDALLSAAMAMQGADVTPTASQIAACEHAKSQLDTVLARWNALRTTGLAELNARRKAAGLAPVISSE
ncbi:MAG TPA: hypothetical protein VGT98_17650, partial [Candidatus Elarobacter sp.]|nr:hypothetical protein [Candidatus Elarobacter sp.]